MSKVTIDLQALYQEGYRSIAIVFAHSYVWPEHEHQTAQIAREIGFDNVSVSADLEAKIGFIARGQSATADAYLTPEVKRYLNGFAKGFKNRLQDGDCRVEFMQSDGALADFRSFAGLRAILCTFPPSYAGLLLTDDTAGPAGGVVGFARTSYDSAEGSPVVGFDMGGTVSLPRFLANDSPPMSRATMASSSMCLVPPPPASLYKCRSSTSIRLPPGEGPS